MRIPARSIPTVMVSIAALAFVAWISLAAGGRESLYAGRPAAAVSAR